ncbi:MAG: FGGY-family carbohydrate kinase [Thermodesulfobacteriota bacterium]
MTSRGPLFAALDYGTGGGKCAVFDADGRCIACVREPWTYEEVALEQPELGRGYAFDPEAFWAAIGRCTRAALAAGGVDPEAIAGVSTTAQRLGTVFLDARGREIYAGPNMDGRGFNGALEVMGKLGMEAGVRVTGHWPPFVSSLARLLAHRAVAGSPAVAHVLTLNDWLSYRLCGELASEPSNACESLFLDVSGRRWSDEVLSAFEVSASVLPPIVEPATRVGQVTAAAAEQTGLRAGTPVYAGGGDTQCALLGSDVVEPGEAGAVLGTTTPVMAATREPVLDPTGRLWTGCHVVAGRWTLESNAGDTGIAYEWLLDTMGFSGEAAFGDAEDAMAARGATPPPVYAVAGPQIWDLLNFRPNQALGLVFPHPPFTRRPVRGDFLAAFLLNVACAIRANLEQVEAVLGTPVATLTLSGGMTRSPALLRAFAGVVPRPLRVSEDANATALGAAVLAAAGHGTHPSIAAAADAMVRKRELPRDEALSADYEAYYARWRGLYDAVRDLPV